MLPTPITLRVLVVDDNRDAADSLSDLLRVFGADVRTCYDGDGALRMVEQFDFDVGILDVHMPGTDGCELARRLRAVTAPKKPLLVAMTGVSDDEARRRTEDSGFHLHLTKGAPLDLLLATLSTFSRWLHESSGAGPAADPTRAPGTRLASHPTDGTTAAG